MLQHVQAGACGLRVGADARESAIAPAIVRTATKAKSASAPVGGGGHTGSLRSSGVLSNTRKTTGRSIFAAYRTKAWRAIGDPVDTARPPVRPRPSRLAIVEAGALNANREPRRFPVSPDQVNPAPAFSLHRARVRQGLSHHRAVLDFRPLELAAMEGDTQATSARLCRVAGDYAVVAVFQKNAGTSATRGSLHRAHERGSAGPGLTVGLTGEVIACGRW